MDSRHRRRTFEISSLAKAAVSAGLAFGAVNGIKGIAAAMVEAQQLAQKLRNSLEYSAGDKGGGEGDRLSTRRNRTARGWISPRPVPLMPSSPQRQRDTGVSAAQTKTVFEGIAAESAKLGLSAYPNHGALLALSQMASSVRRRTPGPTRERLPVRSRLPLNRWAVDQSNSARCWSRARSWPPTSCQDLAKR